MSDTNYKVTTELKLLGGKDFEGGMKRAAGAAKDLQGELGKLGTGAWGLAGGAFGALEKTVLSVGAAASIAFGGFAYAGLKAVSAVGKDMAGLEASALQLGAVIGAATGKGFAKGQQEANVLFEQYGKDALKSAGERSDFVSIGKAISGPVIGATHDLSKLRDMTGKVVGAATVVGETFEEAGRDATAILTGVAGNDVKLFRTLRSMGLIKKEAKEFNQLSPAKRFEELDKALGNQALIDSQEAFGESWAGLTSSLADGTKALGRVAGAPVFGFLKTQLGGLNKLLQENTEGGRLYDAFEHLGASATFALMPLRDALGDLFPDAIGSASGFVGVLEGAVVGSIHTVTRATRFVADHWVEIHDTIDRVGVALGRAAIKGEAFVTAVGGGDFWKGAERLGGAVAGVKTAQALGVPETVGSGAMALSGAAGTAKALGLFGGGAAAVEAAGAGAAAGGGAAAVGGSVAGAAATGATALGVAGAIVAVEALGAVFVAFERDTLGVGSLMRAEWRGLVQGAEMLGHELGGLWESLKKLWVVVEPIVGFFGAIVSYATPVGLAFHAIGIALPLLEAALSGVAWVASKAVDGLTAIIGKLEDIVGIKQKLAPVDEEADREGDRRRLDARVYGGTGVRLETARTLVNVAKASEKKGDGQKVEVVVKLELPDGNNDALYVLTRKDIQSAFDRRSNNPATFRLRTS
jgi:hypothetical protein